MRPAEFDHRCVAQPLRHRAGIERRRHGDHAQVVAQRRLRLAHQGEGKIGLQAALVQLVEDDAADAVERRIVLQHAQEEAVGHDFDTRLRPDLGVQSHAVADRLADLFAQSGRHAPRRGAGRQPPRLLHDDLAAGEPRRVEQRQRHARRLAGARRGDQHGGVAAPQRLLQARQGFVDGKGIHRGAYSDGRRPGRSSRRVDDGQSRKPADSSRNFIVVFQCAKRLLPPARVPTYSFQSITSKILYFYLWRRYKEWRKQFAFSPFCSWRCSPKADCRTTWNA